MQVNNSSSKAKISEVIQELEKLYGKGSIIDPQAPVNRNIDFISTGSHCLNKSLGIGGLPKGRIVEVYGPEASGKTTIALKAIVEAQRQGARLAFIDVEHALDLNYFQILGGSLDSSLLILQPGNGEEALHSLSIMAKSGAFDLIVLDSVAALVPKSEIEGNLLDQSIGLQSRLMSKALRSITPNARKSNTCVLFINQIRMKIGTLYGSPETTSGGVSLKFYSSVRIEVRKSAWIHDKDKQIIGHAIKCKITKNKLACPYQVAELDLIYGDTACSDARDIIKHALILGEIQRSGAFYKFSDSSFRGFDNLVAALITKPELKNAILQKITNKN